MQYLFSVCVALLLLFTQCAPVSEGKGCLPQTYSTSNTYDPVIITPPAGKQVKNVVLMIGDGMSLMHAYTAWVANKGRSNLEKCQAVGLSKTYCLDRLITDSGAGGTAMATGQKAKYHTVSVDTLGNPLPTIMDYAALQGLSTGVVVTCRLYDATPAAFCAHNIDRDNSEMISSDFVTCGVDFIFGGGSKSFDQRSDNRNLFDEMRDKGYHIARSWEEVEPFETGKLLAVVDSFDLPKPAERGDILARASLKALESLSKNPNGFVLMIEGSQLDDYGHSNDLSLLMEEVMDFDRTVGAVFEWAAQNGETLVIVTADHETGGLTLIDGNLEKGEVVGSFSTTGHSGVMVPVYSFGPGADLFTGIFENTDIFHKIKSLLKL